MTKVASYSATKRDGQWTVKREGSRVSSVHSTQEAAWSETRRLARGSGGEAMLKGGDGRIQARNVYGKDPYPPKR